MYEKTRTQVQEPALVGTRAALEGRYRGRRSLKALAALALAASFVGVAVPATAADLPAENRVYVGCTFDIVKLRNALTIDAVNKFTNSRIEASYIVIYVRVNPSDGQQLANTSPAKFTGPVICNNSATDVTVPTSNTTPIPNPTDHGTADSIDIKGSDETMEIQYQLITNQVRGRIEKRVCISAGPNVDCFFVQPKP